MSKTINIDVPEGFEIDTKESNLTEGKIVFKKKELTPWRSNKNAILSGYYVDSDARIESTDSLLNISNAWNVFATEKQAKSMLAMAQLSQIIQNDERFGGPITDEEWQDISMPKYTIVRYEDKILEETWRSYWEFLAFRSREQRNLFLEENEDLIKQYYML